MNINDWLLILFVRQHTQCCGISKCYTMGWRIRQFSASATTIQPQTRIHYYGRCVPGRSWRKTRTRLLEGSYFWALGASAAINLLCTSKVPTHLIVSFLRQFVRRVPFCSQTTSLLIKALRKRVETLSVWIIEIAVVFLLFFFLFFFFNDLQPKAHNLFWTLVSSCDTGPLSAACLRVSHQT